MIHYQISLNRISCATEWYCFHSVSYIFGHHVYLVLFCYMLVFTLTLSEFLQKCTKKVPNVIVQYGEPRSGSTLQFHSLCLMMLMLHEEEASNVSCSFGATTTSKFKVIKAHSVNSFLKTIPSNAWIFMTLKSKSELHQQVKQNIEKMKKRNLTIQKTVDLDEVGRAGFYIATQYQKHFGLSDNKMVHVLEYLRYWDILRQCCGKQMSSDWRNKLAPQKGYKQHHEPNSLTYPACEMYNITQVETLFINTYIYQKFSRTESLRNCIGKPAIMDGVLDGTYCERCNRNIIKMKLQKINDICA